VSLDVSVVVAAYNVAPYIRRAVDSALSQDGVSLEVIVVDDLSTDGTGDLVRAIADERLRYLRLDSRGGPGGARNVGFSEARGRWIAVLDGDDAFAPGRLARCLAAGEAAKAAMVVDNQTVLREATGARFPMHPPARFAGLGRIDLPLFIAGTLGRGAPYPLGYLKPLFSTAFLAGHGLRYDPSLPIGEDYLLFAEVLASGGTCVVEPAEGYVYTARAGSISHRLSVDAIRRILASEERFATRYDLPPAAARAARRRRRTLRQRHDYTLLVDAIKQLDAGAGLRLAASNPACLRYLWEPVQARLRRVIPLPASLAGK
jgi:succinoglycan biosynthesis protein ExoO